MSEKDQKNYRALIREPERRALTGISRSQWSKLEKEIDDTPQRVQLGERSVAWVYGEIIDWCSARAAERTPQRAGLAPVSLSPPLTPPSLEGPPPVPETQQKLTNLALGLL